ncbi:MAG: cytochrome d ubiquinol oxidase subunit II, partial [Fibromonadales bacterium]|nr:cytochrome d ubiquinol oxidase subunit II [Fibromonadales bacterium]
VLGLSLFLTNGALFLTLKIEGELQLRAFKLAKIAIMVTVGLFAIGTILALEHSIICLISLTLISAAAILVLKHYLRIAFILVALCTASTVAALFSAMYPNVLVSSISPEHNLTIWNCASSEYTLNLMSQIAAFFVPIILAYQSWSYYVFRKRISPRKASVEV